MDPVAWTVSNNAQAVMETLGATLTSLGYTVTPGADGWSGRAEVGSSTSRFWAGGLARRMIVDYAVSQGQQSETLVLHVKPGMSGISGGLIGMSRAKKDYAQVCSAMHEALGGQQLLAG